MQHQVCTVSPALARAWAAVQARVPFLPAPDEGFDQINPAALRPATCVCGEPLDLEMEKDEGQCINCAFAAAEAAFRGQA